MPQPRSVNVCAFVWRGRACGLQLPVREESCGGPWVTRCPRPEPPAWGSGLIMRALPSTSKCKSTGLAQRVSSRALRRYFTGGIEPAAAIAQRHNLQRCVLNFLVVAGVLCNRYEDCVGQPFSCGIRSMPVPSKVIGNVGPCAIKRSADDLERLGTVQPPRIWQLSGALLAQSQRSPPVRLSPGVHVFQRPCVSGSVQSHWFCS
jgi:hypothetical protein